MHRKSLAARSEKFPLERLCMMKNDQMQLQVGMSQIKKHFLVTSTQLFNTKHYSSKGGWKVKPAGFKKM